jgi:adenylate/guanylate cyclase family protein
MMDSHSSCSMVLSRTVTLRSSEQHPSRLSRGRMVGLIEHYPNCRQSLPQDFCFDTGNHFLNSTKGYESGIPRRPRSRSEIPCRPLPALASSHPGGNVAGSAPFRWVSNTAPSVSVAASGSDCFANGRARHWSCQRLGYASTRMAKECLRRGASPLECAVAIQRAFAAYNVQNSGAPLHLRIGLSVGEPVESDNDLFGRTVQLASRVCAHAEPDQILATEDVVAQFAGQRSLFLSRGPITPKGFDHAIRVYEVRWCDD